MNTKTRNETEFAITFLVIAVSKPIPIHAGIGLASHKQPLRPVPFRLPLLPLTMSLFGQINYANSTIAQLVSSWSNEHRMQHRPHMCEEDRLLQITRVFTRAHTIVVWVWASSFLCRLLKSFLLLQSFLSFEKMFSRH